ncbi:hypothetical protein N180_11600 [Pedobacter antarcticus 4BY]|uniref:Uncharacterized protein n=2 Tax=Pedobacter antarcticus TaxID=34086 RepID=A0A081PM38_9SPHI|nr:hypothetical protein N180_11600 [Pedobacter antarcticus 4BY]SFF34745.1 hypothetical protein SAMN03003324_03421 [Pedobacter antarcticus]
MSARFSHNQLHYGEYTRLHFENEYRLRDLIGNSKQRDSIAYSLMQSDLHNYLINRLQVWGIVEKLLLKGALVNLVSVIEAIIMSSLGHLHEFCRISENLVCKNNCRCQYYIKSSKHLKIAQATEILKDKLAMNDEGILANIITINSIRNNFTYQFLIHMNLSIKIIQ